MKANIIASSILILVTLASSSVFSEDKAVGRSYHGAFNDTKEGRKEAEERCLKKLTCTGQRYVNSTKAHAEPNVSIGGAQWVVKATCSCNKKAAKTSMKPPSKKPKKTYTYRTKCIKGVEVSSGPAARVGKNKGLKKCIKK